MWSNTRETLQMLWKVTNEYKSGITIHISETEFDREAAKGIHGLWDIDAMIDMGICGPNVLMVDVYKRQALSLAFKKNPKVFEAVYLAGDVIAAGYGIYMSYEIFQLMNLIRNQGQVLSALPFVPKWIMYLAGVLGMAGMSIRIIQRRVGEFMNTGKEGAEV